MNFKGGLGSTLAGAARLLLLVGPILLPVFLSSDAHAQFMTDRSVDAAADGTMETPGLVAQAVAAISAKQREWYRELAATVQNLRRNPSVAAAWALIAAAFLYGVFHAAGPGHGKAVIATYLLTQPADLCRGLVLSVAATLLQGIVAILIVEICFGLFGLIQRQTQVTALWVERVGYALVLLLGLTLLARASLSLWRQWRATRLERFPPHCVTMPISCTAVSVGTQTALARNPEHHGFAHAHHRHKHGHDHEPDCRHTVLVDPTATRGWRESLGVILAIGLRPCSGALLVLFMTHVLALRWAGIAAAMAMSVGTAVAVCTLAVLIVQARGLFAGRLGSVVGGGTMAMTASIIGLLGGLAVALLGALLFSASLRIDSRGGPF